MPNTFRCLVVSHDDDFREELVEGVVGLNLSVRAIALPDELPRLLRRYDFGWLILDLAIGEIRCLQIVERLAAQAVPPRAILVAGNGQSLLDAVRGAATHNGVEVVGVLPKPVSLSQLKALLGDLPGRQEDLADADPVLGHVTAIPSDELVLHYQPIVAMRDRAIHRVEALVRWQHPRLGLIRPIRFIGMFERADTISQLTWQVLRRAIEQHRAWKAEGVPLSVSVNISALFLVSLQIADEILALLRSGNCDPRHLILEITETEAAVNPSAARALLARLREAGVEISMDDYGVGFSDLERLRYYPFSDLKVDRWLVARLESSQEARQIVSMLASLARRDNFTLTAEGIETREQWNALEQLGCDFAQGFWIARPMPADQVRPWIERMTQAGHYRTAPQAGP